MRPELKSTTKEKIYLRAAQLIYIPCGLAYGMSHALDIPLEFSEGVASLLSAPVLTTLLCAQKIQRLYFQRSTLDQIMSDEKQKSDSAALLNISTYLGIPTGLVITCFTYGAGYTLGQILK